MEIGLLRVAVVTPTYGRAAYLAQTLAYFRQQHCLGAELRWFVLDDSPAVHSLLTEANSDDVCYRWHPGRMPLGQKRNSLNEMALSWNADFICAMDDDDWYGPNYVSDMIGMLQGSDIPFAGCDHNYYYEVATGDVLLAPTAPALSSGNGVLCYRAKVLETSRYPETATSGEDRIFLGDRPVLQHPDIARVHLALLHGRNTEDKTGLLRLATVQRNMSLGSFPMRAEDVAFYRGLNDLS